MQGKKLSERQKVKKEKENMAKNNSKETEPKEPLLSLPLPHTLLLIEREGGEREK